MKIALIAAALMISFAGSALSQDKPAPSPTPETATSVTDTNQNSGLPKQVVTPGLPVVQPPADYVRPDGKTRAKRYFNSMFGPVSLAKAVGNAGISTWRNSPEEWGPGWEGFGKRVASNVGKGIIKNSMMYGMDEAFKLDSHYYRSEKRDAGSKIKNAVISPFTARKPNGKRVIGFPRIASTYTSNIIASETWYPNRDYKDGLRSGTISLGFNVAFNLVKEFIWKK